MSAVLHALALDVSAALVAYDAAVAHSRAVGLGDDVAAVAALRAMDARTTLGRAARALALWCDGELCTAVESHGARRTGGHAPAPRVVAPSKCETCDGTGRRLPFELEPCHRCAGVGEIEA